MIRFSKIDLEEQNDCLYDYISVEDDEGYDDDDYQQSELMLKSVSLDGGEETLVDEFFLQDTESRKRRRRRKRNAINPKQFSIEPTFLPYVRWCGTHESNMTRFDFISSSNMVLINFHSDYSVSGTGFTLTWQAIPLNGCPTQTFTSIEDENFITTPNYPNGLLNNLDCTFIIYASSGKRVLLEFQSFDLIRDSFLEIDLGEGPFVPFRRSNQLNDGVFISYQNRITIRLKTGARPKGNGFQLTYKTCEHMSKFRSYL